MIEIITAIALLCQTQPATGVEFGWGDYSPADVDKYQLKCQQEYLRCLQKHEDIALFPLNAFADCIEQRKVK